MHPINILTLSLLLLMPLQSVALSTDHQQLINLTADQMDIDNNQGFSIYRGNVNLKQGSLQLRASLVKVYHNKQAEKIIVTGLPVKFQQQTDEQEIIRGEANRVEYYANSEKVIMLEHAHIWLNKKKFSGQRIEYDIRNNIIKGGDNNSRVHITIPPLNRKE